jgi:hypothetical protein
MRTSRPDRLSITLEPQFKLRRLTQYRAGSKPVQAPTFAMAQAWRSHRKTGFFRYFVANLAMSNLRYSTEPIRWLQKRYEAVGHATRRRAARNFPERALCVSRIGVSG